jgi:hypothetical protein
VRLGPPPAGRPRRGRLAGLLDRRTLLIAAGVALAAFVSVVALLSGGESCRNTVSLAKQAQGGVIRAPAILYPELPPNHCVKSVSYLLDDVEVAQRQFFPFDFAFDPSTPLPADLLRREQYTLSVAVEGADGKVVRQPETYVLVLADGGRPAPGEEAGGKGDDPADELPGVDDAKLRLWCMVLASTMLKRSDYALSDDFLRMVRKRLPSYARAYGESAPHIRKNWSRNINRAFRYFNSPDLGYVLALSRSRFDPEKERAGGPWQIPPEVIERSGIAEPGAKSRLDVAEAAAKYSRGLLHALDDNYVMMVAHYGVRIEQAGRQNAKLAELGLAEGDLADIVRLTELELLDEEQVGNLADFFSAGVVAQHPTECGVEAPALAELVR